MNRLLAGAVRFLNGFFAILLIAVGGAAGIAAHNGAAGWAVFGAIIGFIVALMACGVLALFIEMRSELIRIRVILEGQQR